MHIFYDNTYYVFKLESYMIFTFSVAIVKSLWYTFTMGIIILSMFAICDSHKHHTNGRLELPKALYICRGHDMMYIAGNNCEHHIQQRKRERYPRDPSLFPTSPALSPWQCR